MMHDRCEADGEKDESVGGDYVESGVAEDDQPYYDTSEGYGGGYKDGYGSGAEAYQYAYSDEDYDERETFLFATRCGSVDNKFIT